MKRFHHIPTPRMRAFLSLLDGAAQMALEAERSRWQQKLMDAARRGGDIDEIRRSQQPVRLDFGKAFGDGWRRQFAKWFSAPAVYVHEEKLMRFRREVLNGRVPPQLIASLMRAYESYKTDLVMLGRFDQGRIHWTRRTAYEALRETAAAQHLDDAQRDPEVVAHLVEMLVVTERRAGRPAVAISRLTALAALVASSKHFHSEARARAFFHIASVGSVLAYQVGNTQVLALCQTLVERARKLHDDSAFTVLAHMMRYFQYGLDAPNGFEFGQSAIAAVTAFHDGPPSRFALPDNLRHWLIHNAIVPLLNHRAPRDERVDIIGTSAPIEDLLRNIVATLEQMGQLNGATIVAATKARAMAQWGDVATARVRLIQSRMKLASHGPMQPFVDACLAEAQGDVEFAATRTGACVATALHHARPHWLEAIKGYHNAGSFQRHNRVERKLSRAPTAPAA